MIDDLDMKKNVTANCEAVSNPEKRRNGLINNE
jgi:hypothetical protein